MATDVAVCNMALTALGHETISALEERSKAAGLCRLHLSTARRELLEAHNWAFATASADLAALSAPAASYGAGHWATAFRLPVDCLKARALSTGAPFEIMGDTLLTDEPAARLTYTRDISEAARFPASFARALSFLLASLLAVPLMQSERLEQGMTERFLVQIGNAREIDADQGVPGKDDPVAWVEARR
ncbi:hypothetical protein dsx2_1538 [Desulfovibrio sp. X2]|uniref:hypothetical protein n=1 Tax=Desulfovibrio sp. X2 TaxID=941449 RepID=UPI000358772C|nr:hypothetical protein [Desulfovibrio sp. X2]EPR44579.1 hypothetical protein dsx2_1538 [Desulfovibrio sp. X2]